MTIFCQGNQARQGVGMLGGQFLLQTSSLWEGQICDRSIATFHQIIDHSLKTHFPSIIGRINALNAIIHQFLDFFRKYNSASATKYFDMACTPFLQQIEHIPKILVVPSLVRGHRNGIGILLNGTIDHFGNASIMPQMNHFDPSGLNNSSHDIDGCIVAIEQRSCGYNAYFMFGCVGFNLFHR